MFRCDLDHIAITAPSLEEGAQFVRDTLGVSPQPGGEHERMGTHNMVLRLGASTYLEVIAPNPNVPRPAVPRWFALDAENAIASPHLATWVARTTDIRQAVAALPALPALPEQLGSVEPMSRGALHWLITIPPDGSLPLAGVAPTLIQWQVPVHPASTMREMGCSLLRLELFHPQPDRLTALLSVLGLRDAVQVSGLPAPTRPFLVAHINTPHGIRTIGPAIASQ